MPRWSQGVRAALSVLCVATLDTDAAAQSAELGCTVAGRAAMRASAPIYARPDGTATVARFTGAEVRLKATGFSDRHKGRARIQTEGFRIDGFVDSEDMPVYAAKDLTALPRVVWIAAQHQVTVVGSAPGRLHVERRVTYPMRQVFRAWAPCSAFTLSRSAPVGWTPPEGARGYVSTKSKMPLFDSAGGRNVAALQRAPEAPGILLWGIQAGNGWVHVHYHNDVIVDAWARRTDLSALAAGETMDQLSPASWTRGQPRLAVQGELRSVRAVREMTIRSSATDSGASIGKVDAGTELYVLDVVAGWASIVPKSLSVSPAADGRFWVREPELQR